MIFGEWEGDARGRGYWDICTSIADSLCYTAATNTTMQSSYTPIKMLKKQKQKPLLAGNSLVVQWLGCHDSTVGGSILSWGTKIPQAAWHSQKNKNKKDFKKNYFIFLAGKTTVKM